MKIEQMEDEIVWMLSLQIKAIEMFCWEIREIESDDQIGLTMNRSGNDVAVVGVG